MHVPRQSCGIHAMFHFDIFYFLQFIDSSAHATFLVFAANPRPATQCKRYFNMSKSNKKNAEQIQNRQIKYLIQLHMFAIVSKLKECQILCVEEPVEGCSENVGHIPCLGC